MTMNKIKNIAIWLLCLLALAACSDTDSTVLPDNALNDDGSVTLTLRLPSYTRLDMKTRASGSGETLGDINILYYDKSRAYLGKTEVGASDIVATGSAYKIKAHVEPGTYYVHIVANAGAMTDGESSDISKAFRSTTPDLTQPVCWGYTTLSDLIANPSATNVTMLRQTAKVSASVGDGVEKFSINGIKMVGTANAGSLAPAGWNPDPTEATVASGESFTGETEDFSTDEIPFYETPAGKAYMIIAGTYDGKRGYYKVAFSKADGSGDMPLLRNHHYRVVVKSVNHEGWSTEAEARSHEPENRAMVDICDDNPPIYNMVACKDYELGVSDDPQPLGSSSSTTVSVVTTFADGTYNATVAEGSWIKKIEQTAVADLPGTDEGKLSSTGKKYVLTLTLEENKNSAPREGKIVVTSGDLQREITVTQQGYDFRHDPNRCVALSGLTDADIPNYFNWIDNTLKGIRPAEMGGYVRDDGLHFMIGEGVARNGDNNLIYYIPKLSGDNISYDTEHLNISEVTYNGKTCYKVMLNSKYCGKDGSTDQRYMLWLNRNGLTITITNANNPEVKITYPIYHVGVFSYLTADYQVGTSYSGWYYYEMVKVYGTDGSIYNMLDRNLGAKNNGYYSPATEILKDNSVAIGGYFKIDEKKSDNLFDKFKIGNFVVPDNKHIELLFTDNCVTTATTVYGENYYCIQLPTVDSQLPYVYVPLSGYREGNGNTVKDPYHANLWTRSPLSGYQGFSDKSEEYGYWYMYLDIYGKQVTVSNTRFVSGSTGQNTGRYKAMPIRLVID